MNYKTQFAISFLLGLLISSTHATTSELTVYSAPKALKFPSGFQIVSAPEKSAKVVKEVKGASEATISAHLDNAGDRYYMSDWSYDRFRKKGIRPNWILGRAHSDNPSPPISSTASQAAGAKSKFPAGKAIPASWRPLPYWHEGKWYQGSRKDNDLDLYSDGVLTPFNKSLEMPSIQNQVTATPIIQSNLSYPVPEISSYAASVAPSGRVLATISSGICKFWDLRTRQCIWTVYGIGNFWWDADDNFVHYEFDRKLNRTSFFQKLDIKNKIELNLISKGVDAWENNHFEKYHSDALGDELRRDTNYRESAYDDLSGYDFKGLPKGFYALTKIDNHNIVVLHPQFPHPFYPKQMMSGFGVFDSRSNQVVWSLGATTKVHEEKNFHTWRKEKPGTRLEPFVFDAGQRGEKLCWKDQEFNFSELKLKNLKISLSSDRYLPDAAKASVRNPTRESYFKSARTFDDFKNSEEGMSFEGPFQLLLGEERKKCVIDLGGGGTPYVPPIWLSPSGRLAGVMNGWRGWGLFLIDTKAKKYMHQNGSLGGLNLGYMSERRGGMRLFKPLDDSGERVAAVIGNNVYMLDYRHGKILSQEWCPYADAAVCSADGSRIFVSVADGSVFCYGYNNQGILQPLYQLSTDALGNWVISTKEGYYMTRGGENLISIAPTGRAEAFSTDQFSLRLNRPDIVLERIGAPEEAIAIAKEMRVKRLNRMGVTEDMLSPDFHLPELSITAELPATTSSDTLTIPVKAVDLRHPLERLHVYVNNVPFNGRDGESLRALSSKEFSRDIPIKLANGRNKIQISVVNKTGAESLFATVEVTCTATHPKPVLYTVALGVSDYNNSEFDLAYAAKDAKDITAKLRSAAGERYREVKSLCLTDREVTHNALSRIREFLSLAGINDTAIFFIAGHGLLDAKHDYYYGTTDINFSMPGDRGIAFDELDAIMADVACLKKSMWIDTCHAGELDEDERKLLAANTGTAAVALPGGRGGVFVKSVGKRGMTVSAIETARTRSVWHERLQGLFVDLRRGSGTTVLASSAGAEYAFESSEQRNGLFTYCLIEALQGTKAADTDGDGSIVVSEAADYVKKSVRKLSDGKQNPNVRRVNLEEDFELF